jgi:RNA polymerase sigma factor (sigma-70 family)
VAANLARDEARTVLRRKKHLTLLKAESDEAAPADDPVDRMDRESRVEAAKQALGELSDRDQEVLLLWDSGFDYREIADRTGLAIGAIGTTLARARKRLVAAFEAAEERNVARG